MRLGDERFLTVADQEPQEYHIFKDSEILAKIQE